LPQAQIQFSQTGSPTGGVGDSVVGYLNNTQVNFTDAAGAGATSWSWSIVSWPGPLAAPPTVNNGTTQTANATPTTDGVYIVHVIRTDPGPVVSTDTKFFAIGDADYGFVIPSAGQTGNMTNVGGSTAAQAAGWWGRQDGNNIWLDALLRFLRTRIGRFMGLPATVNFSSSTPSTVTVTYAVDEPWRTLNLTGTALYTEQLTSTSPAPPLGAMFRYRINLTAGSGGFQLLNGVGGPVIAAVSAPPAGTFSYTFEATYDGTSWDIERTGIVDPLALEKKYHFDIVAGVQTNNTQTFQRAGNRAIDPTKYPANSQATFTAIVTTTSGTVPCVVQLYDLTAGGVVTSSPVFPIQSSAMTPTVISSTVTLPAASHLYEVQFKMGSAGSGTDLVTVSYAAVTLDWG
jgi:hypothetical protein